LWNDQQFELLGLKPTMDSFVETSTFFEHVIPEDRPALESALARSFASNREFSQEFRILHERKGVRWLTGRGRVIAAQPEPSRMIGLNWDVTEVREAQASLQRSNEELAQLTTQLEKRVAERTSELREANSELEAFARSIAHDLRAPLRTMRSFATALIEDYSHELPPEGQSFAQRVATAAERMDRLILDLLEYARLSREEIRLEPIPLDRALSTVASELSSDIERSGAHLSIRVGTWVVRANRTLLMQVLENLISNALKFVPSGIEPRVEVFATGEQGRVRVWVADNGIGIAPAYQERIFGMFERLHGYETYPGTGIGLAIVRRALQRMGGTVGVDSELGRGSRFWFELAQWQAESQIQPMREESR
jgi:signal transduction histidine kinase